MSVLNWLGGWYNWVFLFPLALAVVFILAEVLLGGLSHLFGAGFDADHNADGDADHDVSHEGHGHHHGLSGLTWLGVGRVPISIVFETLFMTFGVLGLLVNSLWSGIVPSIPGLSFPVALVVAGVGSLLLTARLARFLAKLLPADCTMSREGGGFIRELGVVTRTVTVMSGEVKVTGKGAVPPSYINVKRDPERVQQDIPCGKSVVVVEYLEPTNSYLVEPMEEEQ